MFDFQKELLLYQKSLEVENVEDSLSGDETKDILDIAKLFAENEVVGTRAARLTGAAYTNGGSWKGHE